jgi:predicted PurR-regulated permease PerM
MIILKIISIFLLFIVFMVLFVIISTIGNIQSIIRQFRNGYRQGTSRDTQSGNKKNVKGHSSVYHSNSSKKKKIIPHDEGEYVDYEEVE